MTEPVNGRMKEKFRELCIGGAQNATVCKVHFRITVEVGKMHYNSAWVPFENSVFKLEVD